jgi:type III pantothenate kinase
MYLIIDVGNTQIKSAVFKEEMVSLDKVLPEEFEQYLAQLLQKYTFKAAIVSVVGKWKKSWQKIIEKHCPLIFLDSKNKLPFENLYETPQTLGVDRIALSAAASSEFSGKTTLTIDAGTCITYDFVNKDGEYLGGAISPGLKSRYMALHDYTAKLPLLELESPEHFIGRNTKQSLHSGVVNGMAREIDGVIDQYKEKYGKLTVVLTGGDADFLAKQIKSSIFVRPFFLLEGLYFILKQNI